MNRERVNRERVNFRLPPGLVAASRDRAEEDGITLTRLVETALAERLGISPERLDPTVAELRGRIRRLESRIPDENGALQ